MTADEAASRLRFYDLLIRTLVRQRGGEMEPLRVGLGYSRDFLVGVVQRYPGLKIKFNDEVLGDEE